jgi:uncharacterized protein YjiS (DUF1127 family)
MSSIVDCNSRQFAAEAADRGSPASLPLGFLERWVGTALLAAAKSLTARRRYHRTLRELDKLDDWTLRDIGLTRTDLPGCASAVDLRGIAELLTPSRPAGGGWTVSRPAYRQPERTMR